MSSLFSACLEGSSGLYYISRGNMHGDAPWCIFLHHESLIFARGIDMKWVEVAGRKNLVDSCVEVFLEKPAGIVGKFPHFKYSAPLFTVQYFMHNYARCDRTCAFSDSFFS